MQRNKIKGSEMRRVEVNEAYKWSTEDDDYLRANYNTMPRKALAKQLGRTLQTCNWRAGLLNVRHSNGGYILLHNGKTQILGNRDLVNLALEKLPHTAKPVVAQIVPLRLKI